MLRRLVLFIGLVVFGVGCASSSHQPKRWLSPNWPNFSMQVNDSDTLATNKLSDQNSPEDTSVRLSFNFQNASLARVLKIIAEEYGVNFTTQGTIEGKVTVVVRNATLPEALAAVLSQTPYDYVLKKESFQILAPGERITRIYQLKFANAVNVANMLDGLSETAIIRPNERTNQLVIDDFCSNIRRFEQILARLDVKVPEILIEAEMIEISTQDKRHLGTQLGFDWQKGSHTISASSPFTFDPAKVLINYGTLQSFQFRSLIEALNEKTDARLLSSPRIVTVNSQKASILVGEKVPYVRRSTETSAGGVLQEVEFVDVGIKLEVTPQVNLEDNTILIEVHSEVSEVLDKLVQGVPRIATQEAQTQVVVRNGETVVIGGLMRDNRRREEQSIPFLNKIFLFKWLFKGQTNENNRRELMVFITPHILNSQNLKAIKATREQMRQRVQSGRD